MRRLKAGLSIEDFAEDIYRRTLLQSLNVRAMLDEDGKETGFYEVPAGGRRFRALELLVKTRRMPAYAGATSTETFATLYSETAPP